MEAKQIKMSVLRKLSSTIIGGVERFFYRLGFAIGCHPWRFILGCLGLVALSSLGVLRFRQEKDPMKLWVPRDSDFIRDTNWLMNNFRQGYRLQSILITAPNVLEPQVLQKLEDIQKKVENLNAGGITWEDICFRIPVVDFNFQRRKRETREDPTLAEDHIDKEKDSEPDFASFLGEDLFCRIVEGLDTACMEHNLLELWKFNEQKIQNLTQEKIIKALNKTTISPVYGHPTNYVQLLGNIWRNDTGHIIGASALLSVYMVHVDFLSVNFEEIGNDAGTSDWATAPILKWEKEFINMMEEVSRNAQGIKVYYSAGRSFADSSASAMFQDIDILIVGIVLMFIYIQIVVSKFNMVEFRIILGSSGLLCIAMAYAVACGVCSLLGISYGPVHTALPFLLLGIGVDDMFVIMACWKNLNLGNNKLSLPEKMGHTLQHAGISITVTTVTDIAAFLVGSLTILPALQSFCLYAAAGLLVTYIFQATFFVACFVLNERRIEKNRNCLLVCYEHKNYKPNSCSEVEYSKKVFHTVYSKAVFTKPGKFLVILLTLGFAAIGIRGSLLLKQKFDPLWMVGENTHLFKFTMERRNFFPDNGMNAGIYFGRLNYSAELPNIYRLLTQLKQEENIIKNLEEWYSGFQYYVKLNLKKDVATDILSDDEFAAYVSKYLFSLSGAKYQKNFRFDGKLRCGQPAPPVTAATIPFECLQTGYRHIRLLSNTGEPIENSTLFVHVAITNKKGGGKFMKKKSKSNKVHSELRMVGIKQVDDIIRAMSQALESALKVRQDADAAMEDLRTECGLGEAANMKQCLRVLLQRLSASPQVSSMAIRNEHGLPMLKVDAPNMPPHLHRAIVTFERAIIEMRYMVDNGDRLVESINAHLSTLLEMYEELPTMAGIKGKKYNRILDNFTWNVRILRGQADLIESCRKECRQGLAQVQSTAPAVDNYNSKDRSPSIIRNQRKLNLLCKRQSIDTAAVAGGTQTGHIRSPTSPIQVDIKPKSILKKSNSNVEQGSIVQGKPISPTNNARSNSWVSETMPREN